MFRNDPESSISQKLYGDGDRDLKDIMDTKEYFDALGFIKFLTEIPLQEIQKKDYMRRHYLCRKMHSLIQDNLRISI